MKNKKNILIITFVFLALSIILFGKTGNMLIDFSREAYIPYQLNSGEKLFKDIFLIYGFWGYFINSLLYKICFNINILLIEACIISYVCILLFYFILLKFADYEKSLIFTLFFIFLSVFSTSTFSFVLPYSFSTLWGIFAIYLTLYGILYKKDTILFLSLGLIFVSKIEFFIPTFIVSIFYLFKKENFKIKNLLYLFIFPAIEFIYIVYNKITLSEITANFKYIFIMAKTQPITYLYKSLGVYFEINYFLYNLKYLFLFSVILIFSYFLMKKNKKTLAYLVLIIFLFLLKFLALNSLFSLSFFIGIILSLILYKKKLLLKNELFLFLFSLILCSKSAFAINSLNYSNFGYILLIFCLYLFLSKIFDGKKVFSFLLIYLTILLIRNFSYYILHPKYNLKTQAGNIQLSKNDIKTFQNVNDFINKNINKNENFITVPEGQIFNLINKKPWQYYNSTFTPLDFETFGEKELIEELKNNKTDYIIFYPRNTVDYGAKTICFDYAVDFCTYIMDNYSRVAIFEDKYKALVFKINEK